MRIGSNSSSNPINTVVFGEKQRGNKEVIDSFNFSKVTVTKIKLDIKLKLNKNTLQVTDFYDYAEQLFCSTSDQFSNDCLKNIYLFLNHIRPKANMLQDKKSWLVLGSQLNIQTDENFEELIILSSTNPLYINDFNLAIQVAKIVVKFKILLSNRYELLQNLWDAVMLTNDRLGEFVQGIGLDDAYELGEFAKYVGLTDKDLVKFAQDAGLNSADNLGEFALAAGLNSVSKLAKFAEACGLKEPEKLAKFIKASQLTVLELANFATSCGLFDPEKLGEFVKEVGLNYPQLFAVFIRNISCYSNSEADFLLAPFAISAGLSSDSELVTFAQLTLDEKKWPKFYEDCTKLLKS